MIKIEFIFLQNSPNCPMNRSLLFEPCPIAQNTADQGNYQGALLGLTSSKTRQNIVAYQKKGKNISMK